MSERDAIVAWLRDDAGKTRQDLRRMHASRQRTPAQTAEWESMIMLKSGIADAIERGDHMPASVAGEDAIVAVTEADREAYLSLNMLPASESAHIRAGRWDKMTGLQVMARHRASHAGEVERLREALRPFATFAETFVGDDGWVGPMNKERIVDWFGPSDFSAARQALEASR